MPPSRPAYLAYLAHLRRSWEAHPVERNSVVKSQQKPRASRSLLYFGYSVKHEATLLAETQTSPRTISTLEVDRTQ